MMKKLLGILVLGLLWCNVGVAEWYKIGTTDRAAFYLEVDRIRSDNNYVYYWDMVDLYERTDEGSLSVQRYIKGDCTIIRYKSLQYIFYSESMGSGERQMQDSQVKDWKYYPPGGIGEDILKKACELR